MYNPEIGRLYKLKEGRSYYKIVSFENPSMDNTRITFQMPGKTRTFEYKGLDKVSDFLDSIEPVSSVSSELESIAESEREISHQIAELNSKKKFLQNNLPLRHFDDTPDTPGGRPGGAATLHFH